MAAASAFPEAGAQDLPAPAPNAAQQAFAAEQARDYGLDGDAVLAILAKAEYQQSIIDAISRPAESVKPWKDYRPIFITDLRRDGGIAFYRDNRELIDTIMKLDRPVVVAYLLIVVTMFILLNLLVDIIYSVLDPRVRVGAAE